MITTINEFNKIKKNKLDIIVLLDNIEDTNNSSRYVRYTDKLTPDSIKFIDELKKYLGSSKYELELSNTNNVEKPHADDATNELTVSIEYYYSSDVLINLITFLNTIKHLKKTFIQIYIDGTYICNISK